ncbi:UDP-N-acetylmuramate dehydrogenase [Bacteroides sp. 519]|uniref:UDP-N-acetylmuramate dehydrogenase n=1 Tax=Bacteroides sp. 519 TaxID=2302937 RepID=UPI0013D76CAF|nr:UDP-N-acetylmuramate dehydrogenase [Bacteroides sp. 519]NDV56650.1 UDP-N-acetylmuramate dehydrogenase [Bacteroides sp. 519]
MIQYFDNYSLLSHNTFGIDVKATRFIEYDTEEDLYELIRTNQITLPYLHIGGGSNLLFVNNFEGTILHSRINTIRIVEENDNDVLVKVGSGVVWDDFVAHCVANKWYGAENLSNIPGEVGASAVQNIGAYGVEVKDIIHSVETVNIKGEQKTYLRNNCQYAYRYSIFKEPEMKDVIVTSVCFRLNKKESYKLDYGTIRAELSGFPETSLKNVRQAIFNIRGSKLPDPAIQGNAGSFFMNPIVNKQKLITLQKDYPEIPFYELGADEIKIPAGWLIEKSGWKGKSIGPAKVHDKQALVLVNTGKASGKDIIALSDAIRTSVKEQFGIEIKPEVYIITNVPM